MRRYGSWLACATMAALLLSLGGGETFALEPERAQPRAVAGGEVSSVVQLAAGVITRYDGRVAKVAGHRDLLGAIDPDRPWINRLPRLIFVSDISRHLIR